MSFQSPKPLHHSLFQPINTLNCIMALLNRLSPFSALLSGSAFSLTSSLSLRRTWNASALKFTPNGWRFHSTQISQNKSTAQSISDATQPVILRHILSRTQGERILWVDLANKVEYGVGEVVHYPPNVASTKKERQAGESWKMLEKLRRFVKEDMRKAPSARIDSVMWYTLLPREPTAEMWQVLDGLSPKHLELFPSMDAEDCHIKSLNGLRHQWNDLESLTLHNLCKPNFMKHAPKVFSRISSLSLDHCSGTGIEFLPPDVTHLKHLRISENNSCDMFCFGVDKAPNIMKGLEVLEIETKYGGAHDFIYTYIPQDFRDRLRKCTNLREFRLAASYQDSLDTDMASYIPSSVEKLSLHFTRSLPFLHDIRDWTKHALDETWLPHLKSFQMTVDPESRVRGLKGDLLDSVPWTRNLENPPREFSPEAFDVEFEEKRRVLYDVLKSYRPLIDLLA
jgi:hypothetical protein